EAGSEPEYEQISALDRHTHKKLAKKYLEVTRHVTAPAADHGGVLLSVHPIGNDAAMVTKAVIVRPQLLAGLGVERIQIAVCAGHENEAAFCRKQAGQREILVWYFPGDLAGDRVARRDVSECLVVTRRSVHGPAGADVELG